MRSEKGVADEFLRVEGVWVRRALPFPRAPACSKKKEKMFQGSEGTKMLVATNGVCFDWLCLL